ncbi:PleD family two-component system response regulator [Geothrix sp. 21YS21S-4]|uniref:response regulator n=1 Tax=Geothrix sp. 21YS21S-4 TaxID=3068889 RepID=UPI0027B8EF00|nr:response regulator [Geothrix sp. 21YS21S-4]
MPRIAIVDDSRLIRAFTASALQARGFEVVEVDPTSLFDVLQILRAEAVDMLLVDLLMPACPGEKLVRACRADERLKELPILMVSAHRDEETVLFLQSLGVSGFLLKPVDAATLADRVTEVLAAG